MVYAITFQNKHYYIKKNNKNKTKHFSEVQLVDFIPDANMNEYIFIHIWPTSGAGVVLITTGKYNTGKDTSVGQ